MQSANKQDLNTNENAQAQRVLKYVQNHPRGINRYEADVLLNVVHLAARIFYLKEQGHVFITIGETTEDLHGRLHNNIARYMYVGTMMQFKRIIGFT